MGSFLLILVIACLAQAFTISAAPQNLNPFTPSNPGSLLPGFPGGGIFPPASLSTAPAVNLLNPFSGIFNPAPQSTAPALFNPSKVLNGLLSLLDPATPTFNLFNPINILQIPAAVLKLFGAAVVNTAKVATTGIANAIQLVLNIPAILQSVAAPIFTAINITLSKTTTAIFSRLSAIISIVGGIRPSYFNGQILPILNKAANDLKLSITNYQTAVMQDVSSAVAKSSTVLSETATKLTVAADSANAQVSKVTVTAGSNAALCLNNLTQKINAIKQAEYTTVEACISAKLIQIRDTAAMESSVTTKLNTINSVYTQCMATPTLAMIGSYCENEFTSTMMTTQLAIDSLYKIALAEIQRNANELSTCVPVTIASTLSTASIQSEIDICKAKTG